MKAKTNTEYYNIMLEGCKEAFENIELKEYFYTDEAMEDNKEYFHSKESIEQLGVNTINDLTVNYRTNDKMTRSFLNFLDRQQAIFEKIDLVPRYEFYQRCLNVINIKRFELFKENEFRILTGITDLGNQPDPFLFIEGLKHHIKNRSLEPEKTKQSEAVIPDEVYKTQNLFKVGLLFATGKMNKYFTVNNMNEIVFNNGLSPLKIAKELGNPSFEKIILASKNNYPTDNANGNKNIFNNLDMMTKIILDCKAKNILVEPYFISRLPIE